MATTTKTYKEAVRKTLGRRKWVAGPKLEAVGGADGLRRLRELRADGMTIEARRAKSGEYFEYIAR